VDYCSAGAQKTLSSDWQGLSEHLIATFYEVDSKGIPVVGPNGEQTIVKAPLTESSLDVVLNWQSPFEQMSAESKAPTLFAMLQSGALQPIADAMFGKGGNAQQKSTSFLKQFEGRTGITKLNSVQVFSGMPPLKLPLTAHFRAWTDPASEVNAPVDQLMAWSFPQFLESDSTLLSRAIEGIKGERDALSALLPSKSPTYIALQYKGRTYSPLVIEAINYPTNSPIDENGDYVEMAIAMTLCTLTAIDRNDWKSMAS